MEAKVVGLQSVGRWWYCPRDEELAQVGQGNTRFILKDHRRFCRARLRVRTLYQCCSSCEEQAGTVLVGEDLLCRYCAERRGSP